MKNKTKQFSDRFSLTVSNTLPTLRARQFIITCLRDNLLTSTVATSANRASAIIHWRVAKTYHNQDRVPRRSKCIITGRNRSVSGRYATSRIQLKGLSNAGQMVGARKSSW